MGTLILAIFVIAALAFVARNVYDAGHKAGKHIGSRKGYGVGFDRGRRGQVQAKDDDMTIYLWIAAAIILATIFGCFK